jgi:hypothetical protein
LADKRKRHHAEKILLVGESWTSTSTHVKGFDQFATATWHTGATDFLAALADSPYAITYMPAHAAATDFPLTLEALQEWDAIILSDIGANTLLLHPDTWLKSRRTANRLTLLHDYVAGGGADDDRRLLQLPGNQRRRATAIPRWRKCCRYAAWPGTIALKPRKAAMPK